MDAIQFTKSTNGTIITVGKPYLFKSGIYGDTAIHVTAIHRDVIHFTIDGGEASRQVREFPELSDGTYFALSARIERRPSLKPARPGKSPVQVLAEQAGIITTPEFTVTEVIGGVKPKIPHSEFVKPIDQAVELSRKLNRMSAMDVRAFAREHYSTIGKLTKKADIISAILKVENSKNTEETF